MDPHRRAHHLDPRRRPQVNSAWSRFRAGPWWLWTARSDRRKARAGSWLIPRLEQALRTTRNWLQRCRRPLTPSTTTRKRFEQERKTVGKDQGSATGGGLNVVRAG